MRDTQLINISVQNPDPYLASTIANTLVSVFSVQIQSTQSERYAASKQSLQKQMSDIEYQISLLRTQFDQERNPDDAARIEDKIGRYENSYNNLALSYEQVRLTEAQTVSSIVASRRSRHAQHPRQPEDPAKHPAGGCGGRHAGRGRRVSSSKPCRTSSKTPTKSRAASDCPSYP